MDSNLNEILNSTHRISIYLEGLVAYLMEMARWWNGDRTVPPCFTAFYSGPNNSIILTTAIGYTVSSIKKQHQTCVTLLELELVTQFLNTVAGNNLSNIHNYAHILYLFNSTFKKYIYYTI